MKKHVLLVNSSLTGIEYGILRDFEDEIVRLTAAERVEAPVRKLPSLVQNRLHHGTRYESFRKFIPKRNYHIEADVLWVVLMGPENFTLDLFAGWDERVGTKILYVFDTFECHVKAIQRVLSCGRWDYTFTAFEGARGLLETETRRQWYVIPQGVKLQRFKPAPIEQKVIDFCSYGRQVPTVHKSVKAYCTSANKSYDFNTTRPHLAQDVTPQDSYQKYAWHLSHSVFNFCWPLDLTHPSRVRSFSPISPRYFEAAASGNVMLGQAPKDGGFEKLFGENAVIPINPDLDHHSLLKVWETLERQRDSLLASALNRYEMLSPQWSWEGRVHKILETANLN